MDTLNIGIMIIAGLGLIALVYLGITEWLEDIRVARANKRLAKETLENVVSDLIPLFASSINDKPEELDVPDTRPIQRWKVDQMWNTLLSESGYCTRGEWQRANADPYVHEKQVAIWNDCSKELRRQLGNRPVVWQGGQVVDVWAGGYGPKPLVPEPVVVRPYVAPVLDRYAFRKEQIIDIVREHRPSNSFGNGYVSGAKETSLKLAEDMRKIATQVREDQSAAQAEIAALKRKLKRLGSTTKKKRV